MFQYIIITIEILTIFLNIGLKYTDILNFLFDSNLDVTHLNSFL